MASLTKLFILILIVSSAQSALFFHHSLRRVDEYLQLEKITNFLSHLKHKIKEAKLFTALDAKGQIRDRAKSHFLESLLNQKVEEHDQEEWVRLYRR